MNQKPEIKSSLLNVSWAQQFKVEKMQDPRCEQSEGSFQRPGTFGSSQDKIVRTLNRLNRIRKRTKQNPNPTLHINLMRLSINRSIIFEEWSFTWPKHSPQSFRNRGPNTEEVLHRSKLVTVHVKIWKYYLMLPQMKNTAFIWSVP